MEPEGVPQTKLSGPRTCISCRNSQPTRKRDRILAKYSGPDRGRARGPWQRGSRRSPYLRAQLAGPPPGLPPTPARGELRGLEHRPGSVWATRPAFVKPRPRPGGAAGADPAARRPRVAFGVVSDQRGAALNSAPGPALPRPRSSVQFEPGTGLRGRQAKLSRPARDEGWAAGATGG